MNLLKEEYKALSDSMAKKSNIVPDMLRAFLIGGAICVAGQVILNMWSKMDIGEDVASSMTSVTMIFLGALFTGLGIYDKIAKAGGAGTLVPITGFSNAVTSAAIEFKSEGLLMGTSIKMFIIAGPVIVYGVVASVIYAFVMYVFKLY